MMAKQKRNLTERFHVKAFIPPAEIIRIAGERTEGIVSAFIFEGGSRYDKLTTFARSCYMHGMNDAIDAALRAGCTPPKENIEKL